MHHSSTSTEIPNFTEIEETFCGGTDVRTGGRTFETHFIRSTRRSRPNNMLAFYVITNLLTYIHNCIIMYLKRVSAIN